MKMRNELRGASEIPPPRFRSTIRPAISIPIQWPAKSATTFKRILVPTDFSAVADAALRAAVRMAKQQRGRVLLLHVVEPAYGSGFLDSSIRTSVRDAATKDALKKLKEQVGRVPHSQVQFELLVEYGNAQHKVLETAELLNPDLIILGRRAGSSFRRFVLGGVSSDVLNGAACPVLLINDRRPERFDHERPQLRYQEATES